MKRTGIWKLTSLHLPLRYTWKLSRNATDEKTNIIISYSADGKSGYGEAAPNIRYDETPELLKKQFETLLPALQQEELTDPDRLQEIFEEQGTTYALRFAIESAWMHQRNQCDRQLLQNSLKIPFRNDVPTSYTIPIMDPGLIRDFYESHRLSRFESIKLKIDRDSAAEMLDQLIVCDPKKILLDANEAFKDVEDCIRFLESIRNLPLELVEQPLPSHLKDEAEYMKRYSPFILFADEAVTHDPDMDHVVKAYHGVNMKLMKAGGYAKGVRILKEAHDRGLRTMVGCMVETTLGISSALCLSGLADYTDLDSFLLLKKEPFGLLEEENGCLRFRNPEIQGLIDEPIG